MLNSRVKTMKIKVKYFQSLFGLRRLLGHIPGSAAAKCSAAALAASAAQRVRHGLFLLLFHLWFYSREPAATACLQPRSCKLHGLSVCSHGVGLQRQKHLHLHMLHQQQTGKHPNKKYKFS